MGVMRRSSRTSPLLLTALLLSLSCICLSPSTLTAKVSDMFAIADEPEEEPEAISPEVSATFRKGAVRAAYVVAAMSLPRLRNASTHVQTAAKAISLAAVGAAILHHPDLHAATSVEVRRTLHVPWKQWAIQEEKWIGPVNFDRAGMRIAAWDDYAVIASIMIGCLMGLFGNLQGNAPDKDADVKERVAYDVGLGLVTLGMLCSTWTLVIFLFNKIYCVKAISMYNDVSYDVYMKATEPYRRRAFRMLLSSFFCYLVAYILHMFSIYGGGKKGAVACALAFVVTVMTVIELDGVVMSARENTPIGMRSF